MKFFHIALCILATIGFFLYGCYWSEHGNWLNAGLSWTMSAVFVIMTALWMGE